MDGEDLFNILGECLARHGDPFLQKEGWGRLFPNEKQAWNEAASRIEEDNEEQVADEFRGPLPNWPD